MMHQVIRVDLIHNPVSVILCSSGKNNHLEADIVHVFEKIMAARPDFIIARTV